MGLFYPLGGGNEVGSSCYFLNFGSYKIILDAGIRMSGNKKYPDFSEIINKGHIDGLWEIDYIFISHAHMDHVGALPLIIDQIKCNIYISSDSYDVYKEVLYLSAEYLKKDKKTEMFLLNQVGKVLKKTKMLNFNKDYKFENLKVRLFKAGHILGAASIFLQYDNKKILYTGDFTTTSSEIFESTQISENLNIDVLISESTYGYIRNSSDENNDKKSFIRQVRKVLENNGNVLIPSFALGKSQEITMLLKKYINNAVLPSDTEILIDGLCIVFSKIYQKNGINIFDNNVKIAKNNFYKKINNEKRKIIITSSASLIKKSKSYLYYQEMKKNNKNKIFLSEYKDEEYIDNSLIDSYYYRIPTHTDIFGIKKLIEDTNPKKVIFVHGNFSYKNSENLYSKFLVLFPEKEFLQSINNKEYYF
jgi:Cft2 family RNA processing exonuclease